MSTIDSRFAKSVGISTDTTRTPIVPDSHVGWTAVVAGSLLGSQGTVLFWAGVIGVLAMFARQGVKMVSRNVRRANLVIDNAPFARTAESYSRSE